MSHASDLHVVEVGVAAEEEEVQLLSCHMFGKTWGVGFLFVPQDYLGYHLGPSCKMEKNTVYHQYGCRTINIHTCYILFALSQKLFPR